MIVDPSHLTLLRKTAVALLALALVLLLVWLTPVLQFRLSSATTTAWHTLFEMAAVVASMMVFIVGWHAIGRIQTRPVGLASILFFGVAILDSLHTLAFPGMPVFVPVYSQDQSITLFLAARLLAALAILSIAVVPAQAIFEPSTVRKVLLGVTGFAVAVGAFALLQPQLLPVYLVLGSGLTATKVYSEYVIIVLNVAAAIGFLWRMRGPQPFPVVTLFGAAVVMALSEFLFTLYATTNDQFILLGHVYKVIAYGLIYRAIFFENIWKQFERYRRSEDDQRRAQEMALEAQNILAAVIEGSMDAVIAVDQDERIIMFGTSAENLFRVKAADVMGKNLEQFIPERFRGGHRGHMRAYRDSGVTMRAFGQFMPVLALLSDGTETPIEASISHVQSEGRDFFAVTIRDITEKKLAEAAGAALEEQLRESQKMEALGTMAGGIAHDFNNALATILGNAELARQDSVNNPSALESLEEIHKAGVRARDLVQQILSFSRQQPTERKPMDIAPVVQEAARLLRRTLPARLILEVHCTSDVPMVLADATQIEQILINLAGNSMQAMPHGAGRIVFRLDTVMLDLGRLEHHPELTSLYNEHPGLTVRLSVTDTGMGMEADILTRIFEPFFTTKPMGQGTGLGLAVVYGMVRGHEGVITAQSEPGQGAIFTVYLAAADVGGGAQHPASSAAGDRVVRDSGHRILYIDDDAALVSLIRRRLERYGFRVNAYTDQEEALTALRADPQAFDLVLTDYNMPGKSGLDVAREVRKIRADLPVAVASGFIDEALRSQVDEAGVRRLLLKVDDAEVFCAVIQQLVDDADQSSNATGVKR